MRELKRQIGSLLFERVGLLALANQSTLPNHPAEMIRDPYVVEFLGLKKEQLYTESQIEQALLDHLPELLLGHGNPKRPCRRCPGWLIDFLVVPLPSLVYN